jgi:hypothetical protein
MASSSEVAALQVHRQWHHEVHYTNSGAVAEVQEVNCAALSER